MIRKALFATALFAFASCAHTATDYPSGYTKCAKEGATCSFSGTRSVAYGKSGSFVYATLTGPITCSGSLFPAINVGTPLKGAPVTYAIGPKQYVAVQASGRHLLGLGFIIGGDQLDLLAVDEQVECTGELEPMDHRH